MRYLIDGCYGDANIGDECLLRAVAGLVRRADADAQIAAFSSDPADTAATAGLEAIAQCNPFGHNIYGSLVKGLLWRTWEQIRRCDVFILGGGELYRDHVGLSATLGMFYRLRLARWLGKRVFALGVGAQAASTWWGRPVLRGALRDAQALVFRDQEALDVAQDLAPGLPRACCTPDLVFSLDWETFRTQRVARRAPDARLRIGVALKSLPARHWNSAVVSQRLPAMLAEVLSDLARRQPCQVSLLPFAAADQPLAEELAARLRNAGVEIGPVPPPSIGRLQQAVAELDCLVAVPFHASVFAFSCGVPTVGLAYDAKVTRLYQAFRLQEQCLAVSDLSAASLTHRLDQTLCQRETLGRRLLAVSEQARVTVVETVSKLLATANGGN